MGKTIGVIKMTVNLVTAGGNLLRNLELLYDISSWQNTTEILAYWRSTHDTVGVYTSNMAYFSTQGEELVVTLVEKVGNLLMEQEHREKIFNGIKDNPLFVITQEMNKFVREEAIDNPTSVQAKYSELHIKSDSNYPEICYIESSPENSDGENKLFELVYFTICSVVVKRQLPNSSYLLT